MYWIVVPMMKMMMMTMKTNNYMKINKEIGWFRPIATSLFDIDAKIKKGRYFVEWLPKVKQENVIELDRSGYPIPNIGARENRDGNLTLFLSMEWKERFAFLNDELTVDGLTLSQFEDPGFYQSRQVQIWIASPSCLLDPAFI